LRRSTLLGFAESLQIAKLVDGVVALALAGQTERRETRLTLYGSEQESVKALDFRGFRDSDAIGQTR
jgi:hypothetical protein